MVSEKSIFVRPEGIREKCLTDSLRKVFLPRSHHIVLESGLMVPYGLVSFVHVYKIDRPHMVMKRNSEARRHAIAGFSIAVAISRHDR